MTTNTQSLLLTQQELETPRTAHEMFRWVEHAHARFNTKRLRAEAREGQHFANQLILEARPMALFAHRYYHASQDVTIEHVVGNQNYDGIVTDKRGCSEAIRFLEVTSTLVTYEDALRMEVLSAKGHVAAYGRVRAVGPRSRRVSIEAEGVAYDPGEIRAEHLDLVKDAVRKKAMKPYQPGTVLIVAVDDAVPFREPADVSELNSLAVSVLVPTLKGTNFVSLALEGSNHVHLVYAL